MLIRSIRLFLTLVSGLVLFAQLSSCGGTSLPDGSADPGILTPTVSLTATPSSGVAPLTTTLRATGVDMDTIVGTATPKYEWDLDGNGTFETDGIAAGTRTVTGLTAADSPYLFGVRYTDDDSQSVTRTIIVTVSDEDVLYEIVPGLDITDPAATPYYAPLTVTLDASGSAERAVTAISQYDWDLDNNDTFEVLDGGATQTINCVQAQSYTANVNVHSDLPHATSANVITASPVAESISWSAVNPISLAAVKTPSADLDGVHPLSVDFSVTEHHPDLDPVTITWDFGDGTDAQVFDPATLPADLAITHAFNHDAADGTDPTLYTVTVTAAYEFGGTEYNYSASRTIGVGPQLIVSPTAILTATPDTGIEELAVTLSAAGSTDNDEVDSGFTVVYEWDLNGDAGLDPADPQGNGWETAGDATGTYDVTGLRNEHSPYTFGVRYTDNDDMMDAAQVTVTVNIPPNDPPVADLYATGYPGLGHVTDDPPELPIISHNNPWTFELDASHSTDLDGTIANYLWDFNNDEIYSGETGSTPEEDTAENDNSPDVTFTAYGTYRVCVRVVDNDDAVDTSCLTIILNEAPIALLYADPEHGAPPLLVSLDAMPSSDPTPGGSIVDYEWDFDGDDIFNETDNGEDLARGNPTVEFTYTVAGVYRPQVRVTDIDGGTDIAASNEEIVVSTDPVPVLKTQFTPAATTGGYDLLVNFDATESYDPDPGDSIAHYLWDFDGDGTFDEVGAEHAAYDDTTPSYTYDHDPWVRHCVDYGPIQAALKVVDNFGIEVIDIEPITVEGIPPVAAFDLSPNPVPGPPFDPENPDGDAPFTIEVDASASSDADPLPTFDEITKLLWSWGDGASDTEYDKDVLYNHTYNYPTSPTELNSIDEWKRTVYLTVTDSDNLTDQAPAGQPAIDEKTHVVRGWRRCVLDNGGATSSTDTGRWTSMALVDGHPAVCYYDADNGDLMYMRATTPIPVTSADWGTPLVVDNGVYTVDSLVNRDVGKYCKLMQAGVDDYPAIAYYDVTERNLMYIIADDAVGATWPGDPQCLVNADPNWLAGDVEGYVSLAAINMRPAIAYIEDVDDDELSNRVMYIRALDSPGDNWPTTSEEVYSGDDIYEYCSMVSADAKPGIAFRDVDNAEIVFVRSDDADGTATGWINSNTETVMNSIGVVTDIHVAKIDGKIAIVYSHYIDDDHRNIVFQNSDEIDGLTGPWPIEVIISNSGRFPCLAQSEGIGDVPWITFYEYTNAPEDGQLKAAKADSTDGSVWQEFPPGTVLLKDADPAIDLGKYSSIVFVEVANDSGTVWRPAVTYYDESAGELKYCIYN